MYFLNSISIQSNQRTFFPMFVFSRDNEKLHIGLLMTIIGYPKKSIQLWWKKMAKYIPPPELLIFAANPEIAWISWLLIGLILSFPSKSVKVDILGRFSVAPHSYIDTNSFHVKSTPRNFQTFIHCVIFQSGFKLSHNFISGLSGRFLHLHDASSLFSVLLEQLDSYWD